MNKKDWDAMDETDRDRVVARVVMRWRLEKVRDPSGVMYDGKPFDNWIDENDRGMYQPGEFEPTTDRNACALVLEELTSDRLVGWELNERFINAVYAVAPLLPHKELSSDGSAFYLSSDPSVHKWAFLRLSSDTICYCAVKACEEAE